MKLTLVEPFASRPAPESGPKTKEIHGFQPIVIKEIDTQIGSDSNSQADESSKHQRILDVLEFIKKVKNYKKAKESDIYRLKALSKYEKMKDFQSSIDLVGNRLDHLV